MMFDVQFNNNKYVGLPYCQAVMYAGHVAFHRLVSRGEYADNGTDRRTDARPLCCVMLSVVGVAS